MLPVGARLTDGVHTFIATATGASANITGWNLAALTLLPPADFFGTLNLNVVATATERANGNSASTTARLVVTVLPVNDAPVAANDSITVKANQTVSIAVLANDTDADGNSLATKLVSGPKHGNVIRNSDGGFSYSADCGFTGSDSFTYRVNDGELDSNVATVTISVVANKVPVAVNDKVTTAEDTPLKINLLANDTDADGDRLTARIVTGPAHGKLTQNADGTWTYTADKDWYGTDNFTYRVNDGIADSNLATVSITVAAVNDAPVARSTSFQVQKDGSVRIDFSTLISDVDGDVLSLSFNNPGHGTLTRNKDGSYTYKPNRSYTGIDAFSYAISDGKLTSTGTITLAVGRTQDDDDDCHERLASIVVQSGVRTERDDDRDDERGYVSSTGVSVGGTSSNASSPRVDWSAGAAPADGMIGAGSQWTGSWVTDFLGVTQAQRSLAEKTGLVVRVSGL
jgi:VCBS repeat-containing protein